MRKLLLATSALATFALVAGGAQAATQKDESPLTVTVGGYVDFRAAQFAQDSGNTQPASGRHFDFSQLYALNFDITGKTTNNIEYGGRIQLTNESTYVDGGRGNGNEADVRQAYVFVAGNYGKVVAGDHRGASDLFVTAPMIGLGQVNGAYTDALDPGQYFFMTPIFVDDTENNTKVTYMTPQLGNQQHKVQLGASFTPNWNDQGNNFVKYRGTAVNANDTRNAPYKNVFEMTGQYMGSFNPVNVALAAHMTTASEENANVLFSGLPARDFTLWGIGAQAMYAGFTVGGSYVDAGDFSTIAGQNKDQSVFTVGLSYGWDRFGLAASYMNGEGYNNGFTTTGVAANTVGGLSNTNYIKDYNVYSVGGTYNWFPGMSTNLDVSFFNQERADRAVVGTNISDNEGHVIMLGQKLEF